MKTLFALVAGLLICSPASASQITFLTHGTGVATYIDAQGKLRGKPGKGLRAFLVELVREMMIIRRHPQPVQTVPFARGLKMVQTQPDYVLFNISRNPEREATMKWVGPTHGSEVYFYKKKGADINLKNLEDALSVRLISVQRGGEDHAFLQKQGVSNLIPVNTQAQSLKMLLLGRAHITPIGSNVLASLAKESRVDLDQIERTSVKLFDTAGYLAFSKNISDEVIARWQQALEQVKSSAKYPQLIEQYYRVPEHDQTKL